MTMLTPSIIGQMAPPSGILIPRDTGLVRAWESAVASPTTLRDVEGLQHLTASGTPALVSTPFGQAVKGDGTGAYFGTVTTFSLTDFTFEIGVVPLATGGANMVPFSFDNFPTNPRTGINLQQEAGAAGWAWEVYNAGTGGYLASSAQSPASGNLTLGRPYVIHMARIGINVYLFINGINHGSIGVGSASAMTFTNGKILAFVSPSNYYSGAVLFLRVYNRALSPSEIRKNVENPWEPYQVYQPSINGFNAPLGLLLHMQQNGLFVEGVS
jgi:hypothetical protein